MNAKHTPGPWQFYAYTPSAAPDLLDALISTVRAEMFLPDHPQRQQAYDTARAAIAKATGN